MMNSTYRPGEFLKAYLNSLSSSMIWMPCSYCSRVEDSPTEAKWPFMVITEGADGCLLVTLGRRPAPLTCNDAIVLFKLANRTASGFWGSAHRVRNGCDYHAAQNGPTTDDDLGSLW